MKRRTFLSVLGAGSLGFAGCSTDDDQQSDIESFSAHAPANRTPTTTPTTTEEPYDPTTTAPEDTTTERPTEQPDTPTTEPYEPLCESDLTASHLPWNLRGSYLTAISDLTYALLEYNQEQYDLFDPSSDEACIQESERNLYSFTFAARTDEDNNYPETEEAFAQAFTSMITETADDLVEYRLSEYKDRLYAVSGLDYVIDDAHVGIGPDDMDALADLFSEHDTERAIEETYQIALQNMHIP